MTQTDKDTLHHYLQVHREVMLWKLADLPEYDIRRPITPTGTNLLGLVKHLAAVEAGYFGEVFDRPMADRPVWFDDPTPNADMWATADQPSNEIVDLYRRVWAHADATIEALSLDAPGVVPWWAPDRRTVTLHRILVHVSTETARHAGHADILRELIDGAAGVRQGNDNLSLAAGITWQQYGRALQEVAETFRCRASQHRRDPGYHRHAAVGTRQTGPSGPTGPGVCAAADGSLRGGVTAPMSSYAPSRCSAWVAAARTREVESSCILVIAGPLRPAR